jgi:hypothetical protein
MDEPLDVEEVLLGVVHGPRERGRRRGKKGAGGKI